MKDKNGDAGERETLPDAGDLETPARRRFPFLEIAGLMLVMLSWTLPRLPYMDWQYVSPPGSKVLYLLRPRDWVHWVISLRESGTSLLLLGSTLICMGLYLRGLRRWAWLGFGAIALATLLTPAPPPERGREYTDPLPYAPPLRLSDGRVLEADFLTLPRRLPPHRLRFSQGPTLLQSESGTLLRTRHRVLAIVPFDPKPRAWFALPPELRRDGRGVFGPHLVLAPSGDEVLFVSDDRVGGIYRLSTGELLTEEGLCALPANYFLGGASLTPAQLEEYSRWRMENEGCPERDRVPAPTSAPRAPGPG